MTLRTVYVLFAALAATLVLAWAGLAVSLSHGVFTLGDHDAVLVYIGVTVGALLLYFLISIGIYVYRDAKGRGMPALLWALVAVFVPYFVGLIVYLIARQMRQTSCPKCGGPTPADAAFCQNCGQPMQRVCAGCQGRIPVSGRFCPACGKAVTA